MRNCIQSNYLNTIIHQSPIFNAVQANRWQETMPQLCPLRCIIQLQCMQMLLMTRTKSTRWWLYCEQILDMALNNISINTLRGWLHVCTKFFDYICIVNNFMQIAIPNFVKKWYVRMMLHVNQWIYNYTPQSWWSAHVNVKITTSHWICCNQCFQTKEIKICNSQSI